MKLGLPDKSTERKLDIKSNISSFLLSQLTFPRSGWQHPIRNACLTDGSPKRLWLVVYVQLIYILDSSRPGRLNLLAGTAVYDVVSG